MNSKVNITCPLRWEATWIEIVNEINKVQLEQISGKDYPITDQISVGRNARATWIPPINSRNFLVMQSGVGDTGKQYISPKLTIPTSSCIHPSTHNQETFGNHVPQPSKIIRYTSYGNTPELPPSNGWHRGYLTNNCIKEIFDVGKTQVFQNCNDKIVTTTPRSSTPRDKATTPKCQEAPRTMFSSQNHRNDSKIPAWS